MKNLLSLILSCLLYLPSQAQFLSPQSYGSLATELLYLEFKGNGGNFSLNFESLLALSDHAGASSRIGVSAFPMGEGQMEFGVPITVSGFFGGGNIFGEIGGGTSLLFTNRISEEGAEILPTGIAGIRYHPNKDGGILIRLTYTPFWRNNQVEHQMGFSIGFGLR
ncbi:MAG: hypothetical protein AAF696_00800 [Bacteroidota bacterium]